MFGTKYTVYCAFLIQANTSSAVCLSFVISSYVGVLDTWHMQKSESSSDNCVQGLNFCQFHLLLSTQGIYQNSTKPLPNVIGQHYLDYKQNPEWK